MINHRLHSILWPGLFTLISLVQFIRLYVQSYDEPYSSICGKIEEIKRVRTQFPIMEFGRDSLYRRDPNSRSRHIRSTSYYDYNFSDSTSKARVTQWRKAKMDSLNNTVPIAVASSTKGNLDELKGRFWYIDSLRLSDKLLFKTHVLCHDTTRIAFVILKNDTSNIFIGVSQSEISALPVGEQLNVYYSKSREMQSAALIRTVVSVNPIITPYKRQDTGWGIYLFFLIVSGIIFIIVLAKGGTDR